MCKIWWFLHEPERKIYNKIIKGTTFQTFLIDPIRISFRIAPKKLLLFPAAQLILQQFYLILPQFPPLPLATHHAKPPKVHCSIATGKSLARESQFAQECTGQLWKLCFMYKTVSHVVSVHLMDMDLLLFGDVVFRQMEHFLCRVLGLLRRLSIKMLFISLFI